MSSKKIEFKEEDIVFGMVTGHPWWPGFISHQRSKRCYKVTFFGDFSYAPLTHKQIKPFEEGMKKINKENEALMNAVKSAERVISLQTTIEEEHERMMNHKETFEKLSSESKIVSKKKKKIKRRLKKNKYKMNRSLPERQLRESIKGRTMKTRRGKARNRLSTSHVLNQPDNMDQLQGDERVPQKILEELSVKEKSQKSEKDSTEKNENISINQKPEEIPQKETLPEVEKIDEPISENLEQEKSKSKSIEKEKEKEQSPEKKQQIIAEEIQKEISPEKETLKKACSSEKAQSLAPKLKEENESQRSPSKSEPIIQPNVKELLDENEKFQGFEEGILSLLNEMKNNKPLRNIEINLKEWFSNIAKMKKFSEIVSTDIGKHLSTMRKICLDRINEKKTYDNILQEIEDLKKFIINRISQTFFNNEFRGEGQCRLGNEDSILTTKKHDSVKMSSHRFLLNESLRQTRNDPVLIDPEIRQRIIKKLSKKISRLVTRQSIPKNKCKTLGRKIEEVLNYCSESEAKYRGYVVGLLEFMDSSGKNFIDKFIFQDSGKCDLLILKNMIVQLVTSFN